MSYRGIMLTGTSASGKTTVCNALCAQPSEFRQVRAVTTRRPRSDDMSGVFDYITSAVFEELVRSDALLVSTAYRGERYGIRLTDLESVEASGKVPVVVVTPESAEQLNRKRGGGRRPVPIGNEADFLSIFLDASDSTLDERLKSRQAGDISAEVTQQRLVDRKFRESTVYALSNSDLITTVTLIATLWKHRVSAGVLTGDVIRLMVECGTLLDRANSQNIAGASYDLSLGDEYFYGGRIHRLTDTDPILFIEPYDYAIVTSHEISNLPKDVCGRFDLAVNLFCQGLILSNGPQVDPGFRGPLFCLLFNTSSSPVLLKRRQHYATFELHKLLEPTPGYSGKYQAKNLLDYLPGNAARGAINELKKELEEVRKESRTLQTATWSIMALVFAIIAIWVSFK